MDKRPLLLIHGYSATGAAFEPLRKALCAKGVDARDIDVGSYVSLNNEITIKDIAEGLDRAFRQHPLLKNDSQEFDMVVHSTGMLVARCWLTNYGADPGTNIRLRRLKHLIGLAPATWGSPQAHKGRTWLGAVVKGNRELGPDFLDAGDRVLDGLELGSMFTWQLAHLDLLGPACYYDSGPNTPYVAVFIGNKAYDGLASVANDPGTDGTVRWAGCALNTRKVTVDLTRTPGGAKGNGPRVVITKWAHNRQEIPMIPVAGRNHATILSDPDTSMVELITQFLAVDNEQTYSEWLSKAALFGKQGRPAMLVNPGASAQGIVGEARRFLDHWIGQETLDDGMEGWQQFVVHARDERGDGITDYVLEVLTQDSAGEWIPFQEMFTDVHAYGADASYRCFHVRLPKGICEGKRPVRVRIHASTGTELMAYQGYGSQPQQLTATSAPVEIDIGDLGGNDGSLFFPFTTTLLEIVLNREPLPFNAESRLFRFI